MADDDNGQPELFSIAGKCSHLAGLTIGPGFPEGAARVANYMLLIAAAFLLRHYRFDDYRTLPNSGFTLVAVDMGCVLLLNGIESFRFTEDSIMVLVIQLAAYFVTLVIGFASIHVLHALCRGQQTLLDLQAEKQRFISEREQTRMTEAMLHNLRSIRHDLKNQYAYMHE